MQDITARKRRCFVTQSKQSADSKTSCKSDVNLALPNELTNLTADRSNKCRNSSSPRSSSSLHTEYYKRYEHDELPVKDDSSFNDSPSENDAGTGDNGRVTMTSSHLDKIEMKIFNNVSQQLQTDDSSMSSLESNIKLFKTTVQEIFDNYFTNMRDFELYKKKYQEILARNKIESINDMEDFIKDMIHHIISSESCITNEYRKSANTLELRDKETYASNASEELKCDHNVSTHGRLLGNLQSIVEAYKNENYLTDSTLDENNSKIKQKDEVFDIYLLSGNPCFEIKTNDRRLMSEIYIHNTKIVQEIKNEFASAENIKKVAAKKQQIDKYVHEEQEYYMPEREIPVKMSYAKKDIRLNEDFSHNNGHDDNKSLISKICDYLCKRFRKASYS